VNSTIDIRELVYYISYCDWASVKIHDLPGEELVARGVIGCMREWAIRIKCVLDTPEGRPAL
jgi:hypothetical protein